MNYLRSRLREPSTWAGLGLALSMAAQAYTTRDPQAVAGAFAGVLAVLIPEKKG